MLSHGFIFQNILLFIRMHIKNVFCYFFLILQKSGKVEFHEKLNLLPIPDVFPLPGPIRTAFIVCLCSFAPGRRHVCLPSNLTVRTPNFYKSCTTIHRYGLALFWYGSIGLFSSTKFRWMIAFVSHPEEEAWKGYFYAVLLLIVAVVQTFATSHYFFSCTRIGVQMRTAVMAAVYRKVQTVVDLLFSQIVVRLIDRLIDRYLMGRQ